MLGAGSDLMDDADAFRDEQQIALHRSFDPDFADRGSVSTIHKCQSANARKLCVYDLKQKLVHGSDYDIGGTYTGTESDLWFYYSTSVCPGYNYLLNLFVCQRKVGNFSIGVSNSNQLSHKQRPGDTGWSVLPRSLTWFTFKSTSPNENHHIKTFCISERDLKNLDGKILFIPISIQMNSSHAFDNDVIKAIKLQHDFSSLINKKENTDFTLVSVNGNNFAVHKIILAAHSPLLRNLIKDLETSSLFIDINDSEMELLLDFLYTGSMKEIFKQDCVNLIRIADKFKLQNLFLLAECAITQQISVENAVEVAVLSQRYNLNKLQHKVLCFIKNNPKVMQTDGWKKLDDVMITKKLIEHIYSGGD